MHGFGDWGTEEKIGSRARDRKNKSFEVPNGSCVDGQESTCKGEHIDVLEVKPEMSDHISLHKVHWENQCGIKQSWVYTEDCKYGVSFQSVLKSLYIHSDAHTDMPPGF